MRRDVDSDQRIARWPATVSRLALSPKADLLAVLDAWRDADIELLVVDDHAATAAERGFFQRHGGLELDVLALARGAARACSAAAEPAEDVGENVLGREAAALLIVPVELAAASAALRLTSKSFPTLT